jgi:hypothetical protein
LTFFPICIIISNIKKKSKINKNLTREKNEAVGSMAKNDPRELPRPQMRERKTIIKRGIK